MKAKILLVDDDRDILEVLTKRLAQSYEVHRADDGLDAIRMLETEGPFAVVVSDWRMPGLDGMELFREMTEQAPETARIMLTGHGDRELAVDAVNQGYIFRFFIKPYCKEELLDSIRDGVELFNHQSLANGTCVDPRLNAA